MRAKSNEKNFSKITGIMESLNPPSTEIKTLLESITPEKWLEVLQKLLKLKKNSSTSLSKIKPRNECFKVPRLSCLEAVPCQEQGIMGDNLEVSSKVTL